MEVLKMKLLRECFKKSNVVLTSATVVSTALIFHGVQADDKFANRFYIGGGVGVTELEPKSHTDALTVGDGADAGMHLDVGFDVNRFLSIEGYAATLGAAEIEFLGTDAGEVDYTVFGISALGYLFNSRSGFVFGDEDLSGLFRREGASIYGRVGLGHMQNDSSRVGYWRDHPNHVAFGLGLEYGFSNGLALRTEIMSMDTDAQYVNVAVLKRFGSAGDSLPLAAVALPAAAAALPVAAEQIAAPSVPAPDTTESLSFKAAQSPYIYFDVDGATLSPESMQKLDEFAQLMVDNEVELLVEGHTDWLATEDYNMSLSMRRAESVTDYLASKGVDRARLSAIGYGETQPISNNNTEEGRAMNRRSEIVLPSK